jgi:hypothetical protein
MSASFCYPIDRRPITKIAIIAKDCQDLKLGLHLNSISGDFGNTGNSGNLILTRLG